MTLDEAIKHARDKAEENRKGATYNFPTLSDYYDMCLKCAEEHEQLAEWLEELKDRRETNFNYVQLMDCRYRDGYNKAISEVDDLLSADLPISNVLHNINEFILKNKGINYDDLDTDKECKE